MTSTNESHTTPAVAKHFVIRIVGLAGRIEGPASGDIAGYVSHFDPDAFDGGVDVKTTYDIKDAISFASYQEALEFARSTSKVRPLRDDGMPNRPLTTFHLAVESFNG